MISPSKADSKNEISEGLDQILKEISGEQITVVSDQQLEEKDKEKEISTKVSSPKAKVATKVKDYRAEMLAMQAKYLEKSPAIPQVESAAGMKDSQGESNKNDVNAGNKTAEKRKAAFPELFASTVKKIKSGPVQPKNACVALNEYKPGLEYKLVDQTGPVHEPTFIIKVTVNGKDFTGEGRSKKQAKQQAAENALKSIVQFRNPLEAQVAMGKAPVVNNMIDFTDDKAMDTGPVAVKTFSDGKNVVVPTPEKEKPVPVEKPKEEPPKPSSPPAPVIDEFKNPVMSLNELRPGLTYSCGESGTTAATKRFKTTVTVDGITFEGSGSSKKYAKQACARSALSKLYGVNFTPVERGVSTKGTTEKIVAGTGIPLSKFSMKQEVADMVAKMILDKFESLVVGNMVASRRKVIAGVVMSRGEEMTELQIISVTTGTKCINGEHMSASGRGLNDCHAEILSRRCLVRYLYGQLEKISSKDGVIPEDSIFEAGCRGGYKLKPDVRFHLYINTAPCGDARIFSPHEDKKGPGVVEDSDRHVNRRSRGQLRTKIESGEGTIPVTSSDGIQTWDGVLQGSRLLTMSCSDKVCRWNVLGIQGALLSYFVEPIYFHSVVLGSLFHSTHMLRAVTGRIKNTVSGLPQPFRLHTPKLNLLSSPEARQPGKSPNHSVNWTQGDAEKEIIDATKGKALDDGMQSRLCKRTFFTRWLVLSEKGKLSCIQSLPSPLPRVYSQAKHGSKDFQEAKAILYKAFKKANLGDWVKKPMEQDEFEIN